MASVLGAVVLMLVAVSIPLAGLVRQLTVAGEAATVIPVLVSAAVGVVVARHQPANPLGWLLIFFTLLLMLSIDGGYLAVYCYRLGHRGLWFGPAAVLLVPLWALAAVLFSLVILLFPDGRLTGRRWRWARLAAAALFAPLRRRVQRAVDRRFNRARYDADQTVAAFAAGLKDAVDLDSVRDGLADVVYRTLEPVHVSVWLTRRD